jgi:hypothetical protein
VGGVCDYVVGLGVGVSGRGRYSPKARHHQLRLEQQRLLAATARAAQQWRGGRHPPQRRAKLVRRCAQSGPKMHSSLLRVPFPANHEYLSRQSVSEMVPTSPSLAAMEYLSVCCCIETNTRECANIPHAN